MVLNKKGLSQVVTTVLIILIVIVAVVIIWAAVRPIFTNVEDRLTAECITIDLDIIECNLIDLLPVGALDGVNDATEVIVSRGAGAGDLQGIRFIFEDDNDVTDREFESVDTNLQELDSDTFTFTTDAYSGRSVDIAPLVSAQQILCNPIQLSVPCNP